MIMTYCNRCILPDTRPGIVIDDEGVCSACRGHDLKETGIDWKAREKDFSALVASAKERATGYDCIVPVSGGKDSWYQIIRAQEYGMTVLAVTWRTPARTEIGQRNLDEMIRCLGVDHIDYTIDPDVERRFMLAAFEEVGATGLPMHMALFAIPIRLAVQFRVPLIVWGENAQLEYGGTVKEQLATRLDADWLAKHGCLQSTNAADWVGKEGLTRAELSAYQLPDKPDYSVDSVFLGSFFKWSSFENTRIAEAHGFRYQKDDLRTGSWDFADIDCRFISLHHFVKWYKFGITRTFDNLSVQIRDGQLSRDDAIARLREQGLQIPQDDIDAFCKFVDRPVDWFWQTCEKFRNTDIWVQRGDVWTIPGFLVEGWEWPKKKANCG